MYACIKPYGLECKKQLEKVGEYPDVVIAASARKQLRRYRVSVLDGQIQRQEHQGPGG